MKRQRISKAVQRVIRKKTGLLLDISLGGVKQANSVQLGPHGDIRHDPRVVPFPLPDKCVNTAVVTHVLEFVAPDRWFAWWDELHRVMRPGGVVFVSGPYGGDESIGWLHEPGHLTRVVELSFAWLDSDTPVYKEHAKAGRKDPRPWRVLALRRAPATIGVSYEAQLQTRIAS